MNHSGDRHHWLTRLYPPSWRARYGTELDELLRQEGVGLRQVVDVVKAAAIERLLNPSKLGVRAMQPYPQSAAFLVRKPSAIIPIAMSLAAFALVVASVTLFGAKREPDEGATAHIWQLLVAGQLPFLAWFLIHWAKRDLKAAVTVLGIQVIALAAALLPVWYFGL